MIRNEVQKICLPSMREEWAPDSKFKCFISGFGLSSIKELSKDDWIKLTEGFGPPLVVPGRRHTPNETPFTTLLESFIKKHGILKWSQTDVDLLNKECQDWLEPELPIRLPKGTKNITDDLICSRLSKDALTSVRQVFNFGIKYVLNIKNLMIFLKYLKKFQF